MTEDQHIYEDFCEESELIHDENNSLWAIKFAKYRAEKKGQTLPIQNVRLSFDELRNELIRYNAKSEYIQAAIIMIRKIFENNNEA